ncbi:hypothetical protein ACTFIU_004186 [Dictyostelium citrinum]
MKLFITIFILSIIINCCFSIIPTSVRLAFTKNQDEVRATWWTDEAMDSPIVLFSSELFIPEQDSVNGIEATVMDYDTLGFHGHPTTAILTGLQEMTQYFYCVGNKHSGEYTPVYNFTTGKINQVGGEITPFTFSIFGDMGYGGKGLDSDFYTVANLNERSNDLAFNIHVGDIAYADETWQTVINGNQTIWNQFLDSINPVSSHLIYMTCPGNHDIFYDLSVYRRTWLMPTDDSDKVSWYSFDYNGVHFVGISSEHDFLPLSPQHTWIENDLNNFRSKNPDNFIVMFAHRPFYCSTVWNWCNTTEDYLKKAFVYSLENLLYKYNVDMFISGHTHSSERTLPTYNGQPMGTYSNPKATIHITVGTGGNSEGNQHHWYPQPVWSSGYRISDNGFGLMNFINSTTLSWQFVANINNTIIDEIFITKGQF